MSDFVTSGNCRTFFFGGHFMKKRLCFLTVLLPLFFSCGWEIPEKISVKTDADYAFTVGGFEKQLSDRGMKSVHVRGIAE